MKRIIISDATLCADNGMSFREKLEAARMLERLTVDRIELPVIKDEKTDVLFVRTISSFVKNSIISVGAGADSESITNAAAALERTAKPMIRIELPVSVVGMEYSGKKKPSAMLEWIKSAVEAAKKLCPQVEFCALDATRAEPEFLEAALKAAEASGADYVCLCDSAAVMLPDEFAEFITKSASAVQVPLGVCCSDRNGISAALAVTAIRTGASCVKIGINCDLPSLRSFAALTENLGKRYGFETGLRYTEINRIINKINNLRPGNEAVVEDSQEKLPEEDIMLCAGDGKEAAIAAMEKLGYFLSDSDTAKVCSEVSRMAAKKPVGAKELDAIIASIALQAAPTYELKTFVVNSGNIFQSSAQITLVKDGHELTGICVGNGPVDAAFRAIDQITGIHFELDDFQIQSVTEGKEAVGSALVKLRSGGKLYSGNGISTDIVGASIRAYLAALNRIIAQEGDV